MNYEKAYNKALEITKSMIDDLRKGEDILAVSNLESIFPELAESEDEKIRKAILTGLIDCRDAPYLGWSNFGGINIDECIAWLEKQGEFGTFDVPKTPIKDAVEVTSRMPFISDDMKPIAEFIIGYANWDLHKDDWNLPTLTVPLFRVLDALIQRGKPYGECSQNIEKQDEQKVPSVEFKAKDWYVSNIDGKIHNINISSEKQGEKKPIEMKSPEESLGVSSKEYNEIVNECLYGEQKSTDKVEPKFKIGDWVVTSYGKVNQVIAVDKDGDGFTLDDGTYFSGSWKDNYHLWTIKDAKDGDVLVDDLDNIFIYQGSSLNSMCHSYSYCYGNHKYFVDWGGSHVIVDACPANKEQRSILFQKMKEEGYEWDAEKKELKKIDTIQPKFHEGDWVVYECGEETATLQITRIVEGTYEFSDDSTLNVADEDTLRLWNISDAKDGDILFYRGDVKYSDGIKYNRILLFGLDKSFFVLTKYSNGVEDCNINANVDYPDNITLATKEQCDLLFQKMQEEGYEWDGDKKELKKIEDEPENYKKQVLSELEMEILSFFQDKIRTKK